MPTVSVSRKPDSLSENSVGTDALNAMARVPGARNLSIIDEGPSHAVISEDWVTGPERFLEFETLLGTFGLIRNTAGD